MSDRASERGRRIVLLLAGLTANERDAFNLTQEQQSDYEEYRRARRQRSAGPIGESFAE